MENNMKKMKTLTLQGIPFEVVDGQARNDIEALKENSGASSWNDLTDKPFGEETAIVNEPLDMTFTTMDGLEKIVIIPNDAWGTLYKLSDAVMTVDQVKNFAADMIGTVMGDFTESIAEDWNMVEDEGTDYEYRYVEVEDDWVGWNDNHFLFVLRDNAEVPWGVEDEEGNFSKTTITIPTRGIYAYYDWTNNGKSSMRIYAPEAGFLKDVVKPLAPKYLPSVSDLDADWLAELQAALNNLSGGR